MSGSVLWDERLIRRYGGLAGYPHAGHPSLEQLIEPIAPLDLLRALRSSKREERALSLSIQVPLQTPGAMQGYLELLGQEIQRIACHVNHHRPIGSIDLRLGNTGLDDVRRISERLHDSFTLDERPGRSFRALVEVAHADWALIGLLHELGFNHLSIGVPDRHATEADTAERFQSPARINALMEAGRTLNFHSINVDIGYGRSWQTLASFARKVEAVVRLQPDRITLLDYARFPAAGGSRRWRLLSNEQTRLGMQRHAIERLMVAGYRYLGEGVFVLPYDELAMAQERGTLRFGPDGYRIGSPSDHVGLGLAAISRVQGLYAANHVDFPRYRDALTCGQLPTARGLRLDKQAAACEFLTERLACGYELDFNEIEQRFSVNVLEQCPGARAVLACMAADGLVELDGNLLRVLPPGRLLAATIGRLFEGGIPSSETAEQAVEGY
jgi:oxygen-independent coproporphyrinogen-3 oxidase